jgi:hypothetical protein
MNKDELVAKVSELRAEARRIRGMGEIRAAELESKADKIEALLSQITPGMAQLLRELGQFSA